MTHPDPLDEIEIIRPSPATRRYIRVWITLPIVVGILLLSTMVVLIIVLGLGGVGVWADVSLVFLILPVLLVGLLVMVFLGAVLFGIWRLSGWVLPPLRKAQTFTAQAAHSTRRGMDLAAKPVIVASGLAAGLASICRGIRKRNFEG